MFLQSKPAFGFFYRYNLSPRFAYKLNGYYGTVMAADSISKANVERNLSFKSTIFEISNQIELNFMAYAPGNLDYRFTPYIFSGISLFYFDPMAKYDGKWYALEPLGTEGQATSAFPNSKKYSRTSFAIPFGIGFKYNITYYLTLGLEWGIRKAFTDYLDDVSTTYADPYVLGSENGQLSAVLADRSKAADGEAVNNTGLQRGNSKTKDWYSFAGITLSVKIKNKSKTCPYYTEHFNYKMSKFYR
jgi:hypothetical protein